MQDYSETIDSIIKLMQARNVASFKVALPNGLHVEVAFIGDPEPEPPAEEEQIDTEDKEPTEEEMQFYSSR